MNGSRNHHGMSRVHTNSGNDASDLELINLSSAKPTAKGGVYQVEETETPPGQHRYQQNRTEQQMPRRMASFDSRSPPERSKEWV